MKRVLIVGCAGAGKSTFARRLADLSGLPLVHLDQHYWQPGWMETAVEDWSRKVRDLTAPPSWIMDGNYGDTLPIRLARADTVIHLDFPRRVCLWRVLKRTTLQYGKTRQDMTPGCPERFNREFIAYIWRYRRGHRPRLIEALDGYNGTLIVLRGSRDVSRYIERIAAG